MDSETKAVLAAISLLVFILGGIVVSGIMSDKYKHEQAMTCLQSGGSPITNRDVVFCVR